jgi:type II secretory pathway pseudopilin PulG
MAAFLTENLATILIAAVLVAAAVLALVWTLKNRKKKRLRLFLMRRLRLARQLPAAGKRQEKILKKACGFIVPDSKKPADYQILNENNENIAKN